MIQDLNAMALFVKVVEYKSLSETSRRLGVPVSTLSRKLTELEQSLGVRLLERSTRRLRLTGLGQDYYEHCRQGLEAFESAGLLIQSRQSEVSGLLRISVPPSLERCLVVPLIAGFQAHYPKARVRVWVTERKLNLIEDGVDLALRVGDPGQGSLVARPLLSYRYILVASPAYLKAHGMPAQPGKLTEHKLLGFNDGYTATRWTLMHEHRREAIEVEEHLSLNDYAAVQQATEAGLGIALIPSIICGEALEAGRLCEVLQPWRCSPSATPEVVLNVVYPSRRNLSRLVGLFKDYCVAHAGEVARYAQN